jgi:hypothetical protein
LIHQGVLRYARYRYLWISLALIVISSVVFASQGGTVFARGDTWQGYTLGTIAALLIVWLALLGIRKRRYRSQWGTVQGWTSAHVYLGVAVVGIATLHCSGSFHANIHTYAYLLMCAVVGSGIVGLVFYASLPRQQAANRSGAARSDLFAQLFDLDKEIGDLAKRCDPEVASAVRSSIERTRVGGGAIVQLFGVDRSMFESPGARSARGTSNLVRNRDQRAVIACLADRVPRSYRESEAAAAQILMIAMARRQSVLRRIRRDVQLQSWLRVWLYVHVPLTLATIAALLVHILSTFIYF